MPITFTNGNLPPVGSDAFKQAQTGSGIGTYDVSSGKLSVQPISPTSTLGQVSTATPTPSNRPSSSASAILGANANTAVTSTTQPAQTNPTGDELSSNLANTLSNSYQGTGQNVSVEDLKSEINARLKNGESIESITAELTPSATDLAGLRNDKAQREKELQEQQLKYQTDLSAQNASYAAANAKLAAEREKATHAGIAQAAAAGVFEQGGSDATAYSAAIGKEYQQLQIQLDAQAEAAKAALASGNYDAVAKINANMDALISQGLEKIQATSESITKSTIQNKQFQTTAKNQAATQYRDTLTQLPVDKAGTFASLPSDVSQLSSSQKSDFYSSTAYEQGHAAGLSDQAILSDLRGLSQTGNFKTQKMNLDTAKAQNQLILANAHLAISQANLLDKQRGLMDASTIASADGGKPYLDAFNIASAAGGHTKDQNNQVLSTLSGFVQSGNMPYARKTLTNYIYGGDTSATKGIISGLQGVASYANQLKAKIAALPADQQTGFLSGNFQDISERFGKNPNPQLAEIGREFGHLRTIYIADVFGKRAVISSDSTLQNLFPTIKDSSSLNFSTLNGMFDTANTILNSDVSSKIGSDLYSQIYGQAGVLETGSSSAPQTPPLKATVPAGSTAGYSPSTGHWYAKDSSGKVTLIQ